MSQQGYRIYALIKKKEDVSDEEFRKHWEKVHASRFVPLMKKYGAIWYSQTYPNRERSNFISQTIWKGDVHTIDYDGIATTLFPSVEAAEAYMTDPELDKILAESPRSFVHDASQFVEKEIIVFVLIHYQDECKASRHCNPNSSG
ncbi:hypothetical protein CPB86DRAFT_867429 [Serendipita vermifera]|nr:hypothetical protein CPB86DRAFT_867429 [Serendipita vermifera]